MAFTETLLKTQIRNAIKELNEIDKFRTWKFTLKNCKLISITKIDGLAISTSPGSLRLLYLLVTTKLDQVKTENETNSHPEPFSDENMERFDNSLIKVWKEDSEWLNL